MKKCISQKNYYSKILRRRAFIEISKGKKLYDFLIEEGYNIDDLIKKDKKYALKLAHKWKKEFFEQRELIYVNSYRLTDKILKEELVLIQQEQEDDLGEFGAKRVSLRHY